ncbi:heptaprenyl diphosphate synthase component 1 [Siminovitchia sediminis]|uniref:Heptaprenyl diphosphate synthase component 1 n=1 Tax=Siminovitchia sediminis TaxID=1274353 RepID=A0ABW4KHY5_9BACI
MARRIYDQKADSIKELIQKKMYHHFLFEHIESPIIDEDRILMLLIVMEEADVSDKKAESSAASAMLVQIALDIHDQVSKEQKSLTERQLSVLAGDFFSGLYYLLLAEIEDIQLIRTLANAIKKINEYKTTVYQLAGQDPDTFMASFKGIGTTVIKDFCRHFQAERYNPLFMEFLFLKKLLAEMDKFQEGRFSILFEGLKKFYLPQMYSTTPLSHLSRRDQHFLKEVCTNYIDQCKKNLKEESARISGLPDIFLERVEQLSNQYKHIAT